MIENKDQDIEEAKIKIMEIIHNPKIDSIVFAYFCRDGKGQAMVVGNPFQTLQMIGSLQKDNLDHIQNSMRGEPECCAHIDDAIN